MLLTLMMPQCYPFFTFREVHTSRRHFYFLLRLSESNDVLNLTVNFHSLKLTKLLSASSFQGHTRCAVGKIRIFPDLKINTNNYQCWSLLVTRACGRGTGFTECSANRDTVLSAFCFICSSYIRALCPP